MRLVYALLAAAAAVLFLLTLADDGQYGLMQATNQLVWAAVLTVIAAGASLDLCRVAAVRHACTLVGLWGVYAPIFLPGAPSYGVAVLAAIMCLAAGSAAEVYADMKRFQLA